MYDYRITNSNIDEVQTGIYHKLIYGNRLVENPIPEETILKSNNPFVGFEDQHTKKMFGLNKYILSLGLLVLGAPGTGKTNFLNMIESRILYTLGNNINIIFDTKGDYLREFGGKIPKDNLYIIGSGYEYRNITKYWNIFAEIMPRGRDGKLVYTFESDNDALEIASSLFSNLQSEVQPIFPTMAEQIVGAILVYLMRKFWRTDQSMLNNETLIKFFLKSTTDEIKCILNQMEDQRSCINYISAKQGAQNQGVLSYINAALRKIFIDSFAKSSFEGNREFSMRDIFKSGKKSVIFIEYDLIRGDTLSPIYSLLLDQALKFALGGREYHRQDLYLLIDECALLPKLKNLGNALSFGRAQGVKLICGIQNISSIEEIYGEAGAKNILAGFQSIVCFRLTDYESRQFIINRSGENFENINFSPQNDGINIQRSGHCIEDLDILRLEKGEAIITLAENPKPFLFKFPKY